MFPVVVCRLIIFYNKNIPIAVLKSNDNVYILVDLWLVSTVLNFLKRDQLKSFFLCGCIVWKFTFFGIWIVTFNENKINKENLKDIISGNHFSSYCSQVFNLKNISVSTHWLPLMYYVVQACLPNLCATEILSTDLRLSFFLGQVFQILIWFMFFTFFLQIAYWSKLELCNYDWETCISACANSLISSLYFISTQSNVFTYLTYCWNSLFFYYWWPLLSSLWDLCLLAHWFQHIQPDDPWLNVWK